MNMSKPVNLAAIIVAAGEGRRMDGLDKILVPLGGRPALARVLDVFQKCRQVDQIILVMSSRNLEPARRLVAEESWSKVTDLCLGGKERQDSVAEGLKRLKLCEWGVIHDGARPLVTVELIERGLEAANGAGGRPPYR